MTNVIYYRKAERQANAPATAETDLPPVFVESFENGTHVYTHELGKAKRFETREEAEGALPKHLPFEIITSEQMDHYTENNLPLPPTEFVPPVGDASLLQAATEVVETSPNNEIPFDLGGLGDSHPVLVYWKPYPKTAPLFYSGQLQPEEEQDFWTSKPENAREFEGMSAALTYVSDMKIADVGFVPKELVSDSSAFSVTTIRHEAYHHENYSELSQAMKLLEKPIQLLTYAGTVVPDIPEWWQSELDVDNDGRIKRMITWRLRYIDELQAAIKDRPNYALAG